MSTQIGRERSLQKALAQVADDYDFVCIDTPPSLGLLTINALTAADKVIVPVQCEYLSMRGLVQLQNTLEMIRENLNPDVQIEGILPTMLDTRTVHAKEAVEILEENFGELVFKSRIKKAIKFAEAPVKGSSVLKYDPQSNAAQCYRDLGGGGPDPWRDLSGRACARVPSPTCSARPKQPDDPPEPPPSAAAAPPRARPSRPSRRRPSRPPRSRRAARARVPDAGARGRARPRAASPRSRPRTAPTARRRARPRIGCATSSAATGADREPAYGRERAARAPPRPAPPEVHDPVIRVIGVGGGGVNAVNRMVEAGITGVEFMAVNTDLQSLQQSAADLTVHIGGGVTRGLGSGSDPELGYRAAFEEQDRIKRMLKGSDMVFVAAGAGGGTGTGAAPVIARLARDVGALTVGIVTRPFGFEGTRRAKQAEKGIDALAGEVDTLIVVPNDRLLSVLERNTSMVEAFRVADDVLRQGVQGISDLITLPALINLDFADVRTTMRDAGPALLGHRHGHRGHAGELRRRAGDLLAAARDVDRGRALDPALDHRWRRPLAGRDLRGRPRDPGGGAPRGAHHLRRQRRRVARRADLGDGDRDPLRRPRPPRRRHLDRRQPDRRPALGAAGGRGQRQAPGACRATRPSPRELGIDVPEFIPN